MDVIPGRRATHTLRPLIVLLLAVLVCCSVIEGPEDETTGSGNHEIDSTLLPDTIPPAAITDAALTLDSLTFEAILTWTAPNDDSLAEPVSEYTIRYSKSLYAMSLWDLAMLVFDAPQPEAPGSLQSYSGFRGIERGDNLYAAIKSKDEAGNVSPMSNIAEIHIPGFTLSGFCVDVFGGAAPQGLEIDATAGRTHHAITDSLGRFAIDDILAGLAKVRITGRLTVPQYHTLERPVIVLNDTIGSFVMIPFLRPLSPLFSSILELFKILTSTRDEDLIHVLRKWKHYPVKCYIPTFTNDYGVDYGAAASAAVQRWMDRSGLELFTLVDNPPDTGITLEYRTAEEMGKKRGITEHHYGDDGLPLRDVVALVDYVTDPGFAYRVFLHELGHTMRLEHVEEPGFIMYRGQPLPDDITDDEITVLHLLMALPNRTDMSEYDGTPP